MSYRTYILAERPDLRDQIHRIESEVWPRFMRETPVGGLYWSRLFSDLAEYQTIFVDDAENVIAAGVTIPFAWDGTPSGLPEGWDAVLEQGMKGYDAGLAPNTLSALEAVVDPGHQGQGLSAEVLKAMRQIARQRDYHSLVAPVRPTLKSLYPLTPIERYTAWERSDELPFDPWLRVHARLGAKVVALAPRSMYIPGSVAEWEEWTGMIFPESGQYVVPGAIQPVTIDREADRGEYYDPNVWMLHPV